MRPNGIMFGHASLATIGIACCFGNASAAGILRGAPPPAVAPPMSASVTSNDSGDAPTPPATPEPDAPPVVIEDGSEHAKLTRIVRHAYDATHPPAGESMDPEAAAQVEADVAKIMASDDAAAMFHIALCAAIAYSIKGDGLTPTAIGMAACQLGYDCATTANEVLAKCRADGKCDEGETLMDAAARLMPPDLYASAYAKSLTIIDAYKRHDTEALTALTRITPGT